MTFNFDIIFIIFIAIGILCGCLIGWRNNLKRFIAKVFGLFFTCVVVAPLDGDSFINKISNSLSFIRNLVYKISIPVDKIFIPFGNKFFNLNIDLETFEGSLMAGIITYILVFVVIYVILSIFIRNIPKNQSSEFSKIKFANGAIGVLFSVLGSVISCLVLFYFVTLLSPIESGKITATIFKIIPFATVLLGGLI